MNVQELFQQLSYGELSNLSMAQQVPGQISADQQAKVLMAVNDALMRLYSRFVLSEKNIIIELQTGVTNYHLLSRYAESAYIPGGQIRYPYIKDLTEEPFTEDVIRILSVFNNRGDELPLNDVNHPASLFTPQLNVLQVPCPVQGQAIAILYQAKPLKLVPENYTAQQIPIPDVLEEALKAYVGYKIFATINSQEATAKAADYLGIYENICAEVENKDLISNNTSMTNGRFEIRGWI